MGYWEGHSIMAPTLSRLFGVLLACVVALHSIIHKNFIECAIVLSLIVAIHVFAYLLDQHYEKTKDNIKSVFRSFKKSNYIYVDTLNNCIILNNKGKLTKAQFNGGELANIEFTTDNSLLESFKKKIKSFDTSDVLAYKDGRLLCKDYEFIRI